MYNAIIMLAMSKMSNFVVGKTFNHMEFQTRQEKAADHEAVERLITEAFASAPHSDGNEAQLVNALRMSSSHIPQLSIVALLGDKIIGHILFSKIKIGDGLGLALAPLSVLPEFQRMGIGKALIAEGHRIAKEMGYSVSVVLGNPDYYKKSGYEPAAGFEIYPPFDIDSKYYMAYPLTNGTLPSGIVEYNKAFGL